MDMLTCIYTRLHGWSTGYVLPNISRAVTLDDVCEYDARRLIIPIIHRPPPPCLFHPLLWRTRRAHQVHRRPAAVLFPLWWTERRSEHAMAIPRLWMHLPIREYKTTSRSSCFLVFPFSSTLKIYGLWRMETRATLRTARPLEGRTQSKASMVRPSVFSHRKGENLKFIVTSRRLHRGALPLHCITAKG